MFTCTCHQKRIATQKNVFFLLSLQRNAVQHPVVRKIFTVLWFDRFSLFLSLTFNSSEWGGTYWFIHCLLLSFSFFWNPSSPAVPYTHPHTRPPPHSDHTFPITFVAFHQMQTKAEMWAFSAEWDQFNLQQHGGKMRPDLHHPLHNELALINLTLSFRMRKNIINVQWSTSTKPSTTSSAANFTS